MKPLFTVHGGEYLVGSRIERLFKHVNMWVPSRDTGVDLLVSDRKNRRTVTLQVKFSKDYLVTHMAAEFQPPRLWLVDDQARQAADIFGGFLGVRPARVREAHN